MTSLQWFVLGCVCLNVVICLYIILRVVMDGLYDPTIPRTGLAYRD